MHSTQHQTLWGIFYMVTAYFCFAVGNAIVKGCAPNFPISQILFMRTVVLFGCVAFYAIFARRGDGRPWTQTVSTPFLGHHMIRGFLVAASLWGIFYGFATLPLAMGTAIGFCEIMFMTVFSIPFLKEKVLPVQWVAAILGFVGVLIVARPNFATLDVTDLGILAMFFGALWKYRPL